MLKIIKENFKGENLNNILDIDIYEITKLRDIGLPYDEIAKELGLSKKYILENIKRFEREI